METKKFKPFEKVLIRRSWRPEWMCDLYSHYNKNSEKPYHTTLTLSEVKDENILPYEGNEHLVGTSDEPDEEVRLEEGELIVASSSYGRISECLGVLERFKEVDGNIFVSKDYDKYDFTIRFSDFNPNDMETTKAKILCVKNGRIIRYKG